MTSLELRSLVAAAALWLASAAAGCDPDPFVKEGGLAGAARSQGVHFLLLRVSPRGLAEARSSALAASATLIPLPDHAVGLPVPPILASSYVFSRATGFLVRRSQWNCGLVFPVSILDRGGFWVHRSLSAAEASRNEATGYRPVSAVFRSDRQTPEELAEVLRDLRDEPETLAAYGFRFAAALPLEDVVATWVPEPLFAVPAGVAFSSSIWLDPSGNEGAVSLPPRTIRWADRVGSLPELRRAIQEDE